MIKKPRADEKLFPGIWHDWRMEKYSRPSRKMSDKCFRKAMIFHMGEGKTQCQVAALLGISIHELETRVNQNPGNRAAYKEAQTQIGNFYYYQALDRFKSKAKFPAERLYLVSLHKAAGTNAPIIHKIRKALGLPKSKGRDLFTGWEYS